MGQNQGVLHDVENLGHELLFFLDDEIEDQFIVHLKQEFATIAGFQQRIDADHRELDHIGCGALDRRVNGSAFGIATDVLIGRMDVGQHAAAAAERLDIALLAGLGDGGIHEGLDAGVLLEIIVDELCCITAGDAEALAEAEGGNAVDDAEIDHFGVTAHFLGDLGGSDAIHLGGGGGVNVGIFAEGGNHARVTRKCCHDAKFNL